MDITAELRGWYFTHGGGILWGRIYGDVKNRFPDGSFIHSSLVRQRVKAEDRELVVTLNSTYVIYPEHERKLHEERAT